MENKPKRYDSVKVFFVKKFVTAKQFGSYYRNISSYCHLGNETIDGEKMVKVGFVVGKEIPQDCMELTRDEMLNFDKYRSSINMSPSPLSRIIIEEKEEPKEKTKEEIKSNRVPDIKI